MAKHKNPKDALGCTKPSMTHVPMNVVMRVALALMEGGRKYGKMNWRAAPVSSTIYLDAALGHLTAYMNGEDIDPESGLHHLEKTIAGLMILRDAQLQGTEIDDRSIFATVPNQRIAGQDQVEELIKKYPTSVEPYTQKDKENGQYDDV